MRGSCIAGFWTQGFSTIYMGQPVASQFGLMVSRIQDWWFSIPFGNRVYHLPKSVSFHEKGRKNLKLMIQKRFFEIRNFRLEVSNQEIVECLFRRSVCFRNFPLKRQKQPETELMVNLAKHQSVLLVCLNGSYIKPCSSLLLTLLIDITHWKKNTQEQPKQGA